LCGGALVRTGVLLLDRRCEMRLQGGAFLEQAVDTPPMLHNGVLPAMRVLTAPGLILPLQEMQQDDPEIAFQAAPHVVAQVPNLLNQVVHIDGVKLSGAQGGTGLQTPEVKVLLVQLRIAAHRGYSSSISTAV